jgi:hypothetical protein
MRALDLRDWDDCDDVDDGVGPYAFVRVREETAVALALVTAGRSPHEPRPCRWCKQPSTSVFCSDHCADDHYDKMRDSAGACGRWSYDGD